MRLVGSASLMVFLFGLGGCFYQPNRISNVENTGKGICAGEFAELDLAVSAKFDVVWNQHGPFVYFPKCPDKLFPAAIKLSNPGQESVEGRFLREYDSMVMDHSNAIAVHGEIKIATFSGVIPRVYLIVKVDSFKKIKYRGPVY